MNKRMKMLKKTNKRPVILITNDDGIHAEGVHVLVEIAAKLGDVYVVAPDSGKSATSHSITIHTPLRAKEYKNLDTPVKKAWACSGTPVDCVKLALDKLLPQTPDICLSGINHGDNLSIATLYSGTVGAAVEAALEDIPSIAFSLMGTSNYNFSYCKEYIYQIIETTLAIKNKDKNFCLSVNIPNTEKIKGLQLTRQCLGKYVESFEARKDPDGQNYYWLTGSFLNHEKNKKDTDCFATSKQYISITPIKLLDATDYALFEKLKNYDTFQK